MHPSKLITYYYYWGLRKKFRADQCYRQQIKKEEYTKCDSRVDIKTRVKIRIEF
jgi:hypothetical protein